MRPRDSEGADDVWHQPTLCLQRLSAKCKSSLALIMVRTWTSRGRATCDLVSRASGLPRGSRTRSAPRVRTESPAYSYTAYISLETRDMSRQSSRPILPEGEIFLIWNPSPPDFGLTEDRKVTCWNCEHIFCSRNANPAEGTVQATYDECDDAFQFDAVLHRCSICMLSVVVQGSSVHTALHVRSKLPAGPA